MIPVFGSRPRRRSAARPAAARPAARLTAAGLALALAVPVLAGTPASAATSATSANLLLNGNAETGQCSPGGWEETTLPGWQITAGDPVIDCYGMPSGPTSPGSPTRGGSYFQGGSRGSSQMTQTVDVSSAAATLSGWLGGVGSYNDNAKVTATYLNASGASLGTSAIGPVPAADRSNTTGMVQRSSTAAVPAGTRSIKVTVDFSMTGTQNDGMADDLSLTLNTAVTPGTLSVPASSVPGYDHVFLVMMENTNYSASSNTATGSPGLVGNTTDAPYLNNTLIPMGSLLTNYYAGTHNSDPNYEQIAFGNSYGRSAKSPGGNNSNCITSTACTATNDGLGDRIDQAGKTWMESVYGQTSACQTTSSGNYENDDVPFYYAPRMKNDNAYCQAHWPSWPTYTTALQSASTTPNFTWFAAGACNDFEFCSISTGDTWLKNNLPLIFNSPAWKNDRSLLIVTVDEDGKSLPGGFGPGQTNQVMTVVVGSQNTVRAGFRASNRYDHYSTARVVRDALGLPAMTNNDAWATPYNEVFSAPAPTGPGLTNGGFETGDLSGWTATGSATAVTAAAHTGSYGAMLGSTDPSGTSAVSRTFTAPSGSSTLSLAYNVTCPDTVTYDWASATLQDNTTGTSATVLPNTCTSGLGWQSASGSVTPGHSYTLTLTNQDDGNPGDPTFTYFDDVTLS
ncbi:alkaline phosphatase family protein [Kitasatospora aureofaciens]|uniref:alkaline phosphatase family protein n=1 Tax=Kitasatospora aureofaciens TaxID=1894 RepID=UPI001C491E88|nr:alkaline phosphatase family protein [Kitasatospora aureofaciens]MBV6700196.1 alkaline phosphatase family protein [Kitasatospora aureofaciens]